MNCKKTYYLEIYVIRNQQKKVHIKKSRKFKILIIKKRKIWIGVFVSVKDRGSIRKRT